MVQANCPGCGAKVTFRAGSSVFAVCEYCQATLVRTEIDVEMIGKMALVDEDWSPLQLYTTGSYEKVHFIVVGRVKLQWSQGSWNEWFLAFDDGRTGWMSEAQGFYCVSFASEEAPSIKTLNSLEPQQTLTLEGQEYAVTDIKKVTCIFSEGELPFKAEQGRESTSIDLTGEGKAFASIEFTDHEVRAFIGTYEEFNTLQFSNLRHLDGWS